MHPWQTCIAIIFIINVLIYVECLAPIKCKSQPSFSFLLDSNRHLALEVLNHLHIEGNVFFCPLNLLIGLGATLLATCNNTDAQLKLAMLLNHVDEQVIHDGIRGLFYLLEKRGGSDFLWGSQLVGQNHTYFDQFVKLSSKFGYGNIVNLVIKNNETSGLNAINEWGDYLTKGKIQRIMRRYNADSEARLVLANVAAFQAKWKRPFNIKRTHEDVFTTISGEVINATMMVFRDQFIAYGESEELKCHFVRLPFANDRTEITILLPYAGTTFDEMQKKIRPETIARISASRSKQAVRISLPRFKLNKRYYLRNTLRSLGVEDLFFPTKADFCEAKSSTSLFLHNIIHQAAIDIDEAGSGIKTDENLIPNYGGRHLSKVIEFNANHPFLFFIEDSATKLLFFFGRVVTLEPDEKSEDEH